jgi:hypothetical protein
VRIRRCADVEHEICLQGDAMLVSEACQPDRNSLFTYERFGNETIAKLSPAQITRINYCIGRFARRTKQHALRRDRFCHRSRCVNRSSQRMSVTCLTESSNQHVISGIQEDDSCADTNRRCTSTDKLDRLARIAISRIQNQADARKPCGIGRNLFNERWE